MITLQWQQVCVCMYVRVCVSINTHLLIVELSNFKNKIKIKAFIPCSLHSGSNVVQLTIMSRKLKK